MTGRQLIKALADADLDCEIRVVTCDGADLGPVRFADSSQITLVLDSRDVAVIAKLHALEQADGDPVTLKELREAGVIS